MIEETIKKHGKFQFEIKQIFPISRKRKKYDIYYVNTYLFLPQSLHINDDVYTRTDFYKNLKTNIRLRTPTYDLHNLAMASDPLKRLSTSLAKLQVTSDKQAILNYDYHLKLFALIVKRSLRLAAREIKQIKETLARQEKIRQFSEDAVQIAADFRALESLWPMLKETSNIRKLYIFGDEFISCRIGSVC